MAVQAPPQQAAGVAPVTGADRRSAGVAATVSVLAAVVYGWQVQRPGAWMDEAATIAACRRSVGELVRLVGNVDLVHFGYYLLARTVWQVDPSVTAVRLISVVAMSLAAGMLVLVGHRLGSLRIGLVAGLLLVVSPQASRFAQEARSMALVVLLAVVLTWQLAGLLPGGARRSRAWAAGYAGVLLLLGFVNVMALLILAAHLVAVLLLGNGPVRRTWAAAAAAGLVVLAPFVLVVHGQQGQVSWIRPTQLYHLRELVTDELGGSVPGVAAIFLLLAVLLLVGGRRRPAPAVRTAFVLGATLAVLPALGLIAVSLVEPMFQVRYLVFTAPGVYLAIAALLAHVRLGSSKAISWLIPAVVLCLVAALGVGVQVDQRQAVTGHHEDTEMVADYLAEHARPGDAVVMVPSELRIIKQAYPAGFRDADDAEVVVDPIAAGTLEGTLVAPDQVQETLLKYRRLWVLQGYYQPADMLSPTDRETLRVVEAFFRPAGGGQVTDIGITLQTR